MLFYLPTLAKFEQIYNPPKLRKRVSGIQSNLIDPSEKPSYGKIQETLKNGHISVLTQKSL